MKTDVQLLIAALTTERNALDRAITALQAISPNGGGPVRAEQPAQPKARQARRTRGKNLTPEMRATIAAQMAQVHRGGGARGRMARELAATYGVKAKYIETKWTTWVAPSPVATEATPELVEAL